MAQTKSRRTQQERRDATVARIIAATVDCLIDHGYAKTSTTRISQRAGVSQGAIFRHFPNRAALMIAVANHIGDGLLDLFSEDFNNIEGIDDPVFLALALLRRNCHHRIHQAWFELQVAARADADLQQALAPIWTRNLSKTQELAGNILPDLAALTDDFPAIVDVMVSLFRGEALDSCVCPERRNSSARIDLAQLICSLLEQHYKGIAAGKPVGVGR